MDGTHKLEAEGSLTLTIGGHVRHTGILHHTCRSGGHHLGVRTWEALRSHGAELLLLVVHELLLRSGLLWCAGVEVGSSIPEAITRIIHGGQFLFKGLQCGCRSWFLCSDDYVRLKLNAMQRFRRSIFSRGRRVQQIGGVIRCLPTKMTKVFGARS